MEPLFSNEAPAYWARGLPVIPLQVCEKKPIPSGWSRYCEEMPGETARETWLTMYKENNMGLPLGKQSGLVFIDIDSEDPKVEAAIMSVLPKSPWKRIGAKGCIYAYKFSGQPAKKIMNSRGEMLVEILSTGNQAVLPPSIHPKTQKPYTSNVPLLDVLDSLPVLPEDIESRLRSALSAVVQLHRVEAGGFKYTRPVSIGSRDVQMIRFAGLQAKAVLKGEHSLNRAVDLMMAWCTDMVTDIEGDKVDMQKGIAKIFEFLREDVARGDILPPGWDIELTPSKKKEWGIEFNEDQEEWNVSQINDYIFNEFNETSSLSDPKRFETVTFVLNKISKSSHLNALEVEQIIKTLAKTSGLELPVSAYFKQLKALNAGPIEGTNQREIAEAVIDLFRKRRGELVYQGGAFWEWEGAYWEKIEPQVIWKVIAEEFGHLAMAKKASDHRGVIDVMKNILPQQVSAMEMDGINFCNGFLTKDLDLVPHAPEHGKKYVLDYQYRPELAGKCPKFLGYLQYSWGHHPDYEDKLQALREAIAVSMFGLATQYQRAFLLFSRTGGTGKSQLFDVLRRLVPEDMLASLKPNQFGEQFSSSMLSTALINTAGELPDRTLIPGDIFKEVITGDPLKAEKKGVDAFIMRTRCAHWFSSNWLPKSTDTSSGFSRRWLIFTFDRLVDKKDLIIGLGKMIAEEEMEAIVAWAIEAMPALLKRNGYTIPESHKEMLNTMMTENSSVRQWMNSRIEYAEGSKIPVKKLYEDFWAYCLGSNGARKLTTGAFILEFDTILVELKKLSKVKNPDGGGDIYVGINLKKVR